MSDENSRAGGYVVAFGLGALLGAGLALLYAPRSGKETRQKIAATSHDLRERAEHLGGDAKSFIEHKKQEIAAAVEAGKEAIRQERVKKA